MMDNRPLENKAAGATAGHHAHLLDPAAPAPKPAGKGAHIQGDHPGDASPRGPPALNDGYMDEHEYAAAQGLCLRTVRRHRALGIGPPYVKLGRKTLYSITAYHKWLEAQTRT